MVLSKEFISKTSDTSANEETEMTTIDSNSEQVSLTDFNGVSSNDQLKKCSSETTLTITPNENHSDEFIINMPNESEKDVIPHLTIDSCLDANEINGTLALKTEGLSLDSGICLEEVSCNSEVKKEEEESDEIKEKSEEVKEESTKTLVFQFFLFTVLAGVGTCGAGIRLDSMQHWTVFVDVSELFIVVPVLMGLKGNLEMTLASRLSTQANIGNLNSVKNAWSMGWGNMVLKLAQATIMGLIATIFAVVVDTINAGKFDLQHSLLIGCSSISTAVVTTVVLGSITTTVVFVSHLFKINPDNIATPIAASLGDLITLEVLAHIAQALHLTSDNVVISSSITGTLILLVPLWIFLTRRNIYIKDLILTGWLPIIIALVITSVAGFIFENAVLKYEGMAVFQPVINGVGGNLVAIQASRIATYFHQRSTLGTLPDSSKKSCIKPWSAFFGKNDHSRTAKILISIAVPVHILFAYTIHFIKNGQTSLNALFLPIYLVSTLLQVAILLYIAHIMIHLTWRWKFDPDNSAIPFLTALGDLLGIGLLTIAFYFYTSIYTYFYDYDTHSITSSTVIPQNVTGTDFY